MTRLKKKVTVSGGNKKGRQHGRMDKTETCRLPSSSQRQKNKLQSEVPKMPPRLERKFKKRKK